MLKVLFAMTFFPIAAQAAAPADWEVVRNDDGIVVERKKLDHSSLFAVRAKTRVPMAPATFFSTLWKYDEYIKFMPTVKSMHFIENTPDERLVYEQVQLPLVQNRDYTIRLRRVVDEDNQIYQMFYADENEHGPAENRQFVRVKMLRGSWKLSPAEGGRSTDIEYEIQGDPGGLIPTFIVNSLQKSQVTKYIKLMIKRATENAAKEPSIALQ